MRGIYNVLFSLVSKTLTKYWVFPESCAYLLRQNSQFVYVLSQWQVYDVTENYYNT